MILVGHGHGGSFRYTEANIGSGWENIAPLLDGHWYELDDAYGMNADVVLYIGTAQSVKALAKRGRPSCWRRVVMLQEAGSSILSGEYLSDVMRCGFSGFAVYTEPLAETFAMMGQVFPILNAYPFHKFPALSKVPKIPGLVGMYLQQFNDPASNVLGTLSILRAIPGIRGRCWVNECDIPRLQEIVAGVGLSDRVEIRQTKHWPDYLRELAQCNVVTSLDARMTWGRMDLDAAMCGIQCVGPYTAAKAILFPNCIVDDVSLATVATVDAMRQRYTLRGEHRLMFSREHLADNLRAISNGLA